MTRGMGVQLSQIAVVSFFHLFDFRVIDPVGNTEIASYRIHHILFCARGPSDSEERRCFAFTCSHGESAETAIFQCHVFRCDAPDVVITVLTLLFTCVQDAPFDPPK